MVDRGDEVVAKQRVLRQSGIQVALADFGTGCSRRSCVGRLDISYLTIDQAFTRAIGTAHHDIAPCEGLVVMAHELGLRVVDEGIETQEQKCLLRQIGGDFGQGYRVSPPLPAVGAEASFLAHRARAAGRGRAGAGGRRTLAEPGAVEVTAA